MSLGADDKMLIISGMVRKWAKQLWSIVPREVIEIACLFCDDEDMRYHLPEFRIVMMGGSSAFRVALMAGINEDDHTVSTFIDKRPCVMRVSLCQDEFIHLQDSAIESADGVILTYNANCADSFNQAQQWMDRILRVREDAAPMVLVAVRKDSESRHARKVVTQSEGQRLANELECPFFEVSFELSSRRGSVTLQCFQELGRMMKKHKLEKTIIDDMWTITQRDTCSGCQCSIL